MKVWAKVTVSILGLAAILFALFGAVILFVGGRVIDASKEDPVKLFRFYVQKQLSPSVQVISAVGRIYPMSGTGIMFRFKINQRDLDDLITSKHLQRVDSIQPGLFAASDLGQLKQPEFYATDKDATWSSALSGVRMAVDREAGFVLYFVVSS